MDPDSSPHEEIHRFEEQYRGHPEGLVFARLADAYRKAGQPDRALTILEDGIDRHPEYPSGHIVHGRTLKDLGRIDEAVAAFRRVLGLDGQNLVAVRELGALADERGDLETAGRWYERLALLDPTNFEARRRLAELRASVADEPEPTEPPESAVSEVPQPGATPTDEALRLEHETTGDRSTDSSSGPLVAGNRPADEAIEAILNGDVPETIRAEDTWWFEERPPDAGTEPSRDADLLTRTMADLYAEQGLYREAEEIYEELLRDSPEDLELRARLAEVKDAAGSPRGRQARDRDPMESVEAPAPYGGPSGPPVADELRRMLRTGEERARELPLPESGTDVEMIAAERVPQDDDLPREPGEVSAEHEPGEVSGEPAEGEPLSDFARQWIQDLSDSE